MTETISAELRSLRKGRGMSSANLDRRLGPHLRELAAESGGAGVRRHALVTEISNLALRLPEDLQHAITASLGLAGQSRNVMLFDDRMSWLALQLHCSTRTALRRVHEAEKLLAEEIANELVHRRGRNPTAPNGWYLDELRTVLRLDADIPQAIEHRRIIATRSGLVEVMAWMNVPGTPDHPRPTVTGEILYGGRLLRREQPSQNRFHFVVQLPQALQIGQQHEYGLLLQVPEGHVLRPHYVFTPECECRLFHLRVRFDLRQPPRWVRRVEGETIRLLDTGQSQHDRLIPDQVGEVQVQFLRPVMYLSYGVQWQP